PGTTAYTATCNDEETVGLSAPAVALAGNVRYDFLRWVVDGIDQPAGVTDLELLISADRITVAVYAIRTHTLTVQSTPISGVAIAGDKPGATEYTATCDDQQIVDLEAPELVELAVRYQFVRWHVDGSDESEGQRSIAIMMDADHTAVAEYTILTHMLTVQSVLVTTSTGRRQVTGVPITGDMPGSTDYTVTCEDGQVVTIEAPRTFQMTGTAGTIDYAFQRWAVDGVDKSWEHLDLQIDMRADHTVVAKYGLACDCDGSCVVNVLDLLLIRGKLGQSVYTGDNWKMDVNSDKKINVLDLLTARSKLNKACVK
ncbi:MAG TPA: dockerin type I domain-containing protein, partial [Planctomycetota bacterium]|nr:dockerin type I domain-containing protein [Planctomycetota bacterium]